LIDFHGLASNRDCDINLGTHIGKNIHNNLDLFNNLNNLLINNGFNVSIDQPFMAGKQTISGSINNEFNIWTLQIEINCAITNKKENFERYKKLLTILNNWINTIKP
jgi:N-formylglutamate amidohydrolase